MGRTVPTFNMSLEREMAGWAPFRRALRAEDRAVFDRLFVHARQHMAEAAAAARPIPFDAVVMSILLEQQKELARLRRQVADLRGEDPEPPSPNHPRRLENEQQEMPFSQNTENNRDEPRALPRPDPAEEEP